MGFRALRENGDEIFSLDFNNKEWECLKKDISYKRNLKMPCCNSMAVVRTSPLGLQFFSHPPKKTCDFGSESIEHLMLKKYVYETLKTLGYKVDIEKNIYISNIQRRPDVLLEINDLKIVFEIQNTKQNLDLIKQRSKEYIANNMIVVWLNLFECTKYNLSRFNIDNDNIFAYDVKKNKEGGYTLKDNLFRSKLDLRDFLQLRIEETLQATNDIDLEENFEKLISYKSDDAYILYNFIAIENTIVVPQEDKIKRFRDKERNLTFFVKLLKGFNFIKTSFPILVEKSRVTSGLYIYKQNAKLEKKYHILNNAPIDAFNAEEYRKHYIDKVVEILKNMGWEYFIKEIILNKYQIDILAKNGNSKIAFLTMFYNEPDISKTINYCKEANIFVVVLNYDGDFYYENAESIDCKEDKIFTKRIEDILEIFCPF